MPSLDDLSDEKRHPIRVAARRSGLTPDLLRAWENRYGAVEPGRSAGGQRRYSDRDVEILRLLAEATDAGRRIGDVAELDPAGVARLVEEDRRATTTAVVPEPVEPGRDVEELLARAGAAIEAYDDARLRDLLARAAATLTPRALADRVLVPLMRTIGERWERGEIDPGQEHFATAAVRRALAGLLERAGAGAEGPRMIAATPRGQRHEIGALLAAATAATEGWRVAFLGPDLPRASIASAARRSDAAAIALSVVHPDVDGALLNELADLRRSVDETVEIYVGGAGTRGRREAIERTGVTWLADMDELREALRARAAGRSPAVDRRGTSSAVRT